MKIAFILPRIVEKGPVLVVKQICDYIHNNHKSDIEITVFHFGEIDDINFYCKKIKLNFFKSYNFLQYDIVHSHMLKPDLYCYLHNVKKKTKLISTLHQFIFDNLKSDYNILSARLLNFFWLRILNSFDSIVFINNNMLSYYGNVLEKPLKKLIYNGISLTNRNLDFIDVNVEIINKIEEVKSKGFIIVGVVCLLTDRKGVDQIIKTLPKNKNLFLLIFGNGKEEISLKNLAVNLGVENRCAFFGFVSNANQYYQYFDLFFMGSRSEGFGLSVLESGLAKIPVICSNINVFIELYDSNEVSFFNLENIDSLAEAIDFALKNKPFLTENLYLKISKSYSVNQMGIQYINHYKKITNK
jgi:glycosyltransferase involved in cell wall biosynthesis